MRLGPRHVIFTEMREGRVAPFFQSWCKTETRNNFNQTEAYKL